MTFPTNITKAHLEKAIKEIDQEGVRKGRHSSTYDLFYNDQLYPPKLVISIANRFANDVELDPNEFEGGLNTEAFKLLQDSGFEIRSKSDPIKRLIEKYKKHIAETKLKDEKYKWELIFNNKGKPNINNENFFDEIKEITAHNLIYHLAGAVIKGIAKDKPKELKDLFINLFDESIELNDRIKTFKSGALKIYTGDNQHHQDERSISTYLTFYNPEKYTFYKSSFYKKYCNLTGVNPTKKNAKYGHYLELLDDLIDKYISQDTELIQQVKSLIPEYYDGINHKLLAQDILFQMLDQKEDTNYWIFQGNPKLYDFETALRDNILTDWTISAHKDKIKVGDKVILWITGSKSGCYALAELISEPYDKTSSTDDHLWKVDNKNELKAEIKVTNNLADNPILKTQIDSNSKLKDLKVGHQGTNFSATQDQFEALIEIIENSMSKRYWLYAPGENADRWEEFYSQGIMGLGWSELGDLNQFSDKQEIAVKLQELEKTTSSKKNDASANHEFKEVIDIGDVIIVKKGRGELLGYGIVTSDYYYDDQMTDYKSLRKVNWKLNGNWKTDHSLALKTLTNITKYPSEHVLYNKYSDRLLGIMGVGFKSKKNYREEFTKWLYATNSNDGGTKSSYIRSIEILSETLKYEIFEEDDISKLGILYDDLIEEQKKVDGKYFNKSSPSYGKKGFYSASINTYSRFIKEYLSKNKNDYMENFHKSLNTILYGPPGTGKTYHTILRAAEIIENRKIDNYEEALNIFKSNLHDRIEFITFHQNYSYEDFIQGLRPETDNKSSLVFEKKDGVFKKIADKALENLRLSKKDITELSKDVQFDRALEKFKETILEAEENYSINQTAYIFEVEEDAFRYTGEKWANHTNGLRMKFNDLQEFYRQGVTSRKDIKKMTSISGLANQHATYYYLVYEKILSYLTDDVEVPTSVEKKNYVIIIDEINRANISRVFGELITLIEPDKRSHGAIPLEAKLPSGDTFMVPSNLFIIGTMNTADKSIALLDIALRRRFDFEAMFPLYDIPGKEIYNYDVLKKINEQIIATKGHDFQIGHSYFMESKDLTSVMNKKVIPLLLEYYMNDQKEVEGILHKAGFEVDKNAWPLRITAKRD